MQSDLVSIVLTLYNKAPYIEETIFSIYKQTYTNRELIIVDDCSTDWSLEIAKSFCDKLWITHKCKFIQNEKNLWVAKTFERGLKEAKWEWIAMCDWDDILMKNKIEENLLFCKENNIDFCHSDLVSIDKNNNILSFSTMEVFSINANKNAFYNLMYYGVVIGSSVFFNKLVGESLKKDGFFDKIYQDRWCVLYASFKWYRIKYIDKPLVYYRRCETCITRESYDKKSKKNNEQSLKGWRRILQEENERINYITEKKIYTTPQQKDRLIKHYDINNLLIDFLKSDKIIIPWKIFSKILSKREKIFYCRISILQRYKLLSLFSKIFKI